MKSLTPKLCHQCQQFKGPERSLRTCSKCKVARYCSKECQTRHWPVHKIFCRGRGTSAPAEHYETLRNMQNAAMQSGLGPIPTDPDTRASSLPRGNDQTLITSIPTSYWDGEGNAPGGHTQCFISAWLKEHVLRQPGFPHPIPSPGVPAHRLAPLPGAGIGMFATRDLAAGELIFAERALLIAPQAGGLIDQLCKRHGTTFVKGVELTPENREDMLRLLLARMEPEKQRAYRELAGAHASNCTTPLLGVLHTNAIMLPEHVWRKTFPGNTSEEVERLSGVCEVLSRVNHSCRPNAVVDFHTPSFTYVLTAARTIPAGTEITRTYIENAEPAVDRQLALKPYGFRCRCAACASPRASDLRRWQIVKDACEPLPAVRAWMRDPALTDDHLIRVSKKVLQLGQEEGMEASAGFYGAHLLQLTLSYAALGERERYLEARERMLALGRCHHPLDDEQTGWFLPKVPEEQMIWGHRVPALD